MELMNEALDHASSLRGIRDLTLEGAIADSCVLRHLTGFGRLEKLSLFSHQPVYEDKGVFLFGLSKLTTLLVPDINVGRALRFLTSLTCLDLGSLHEQDTESQTEILSSLNGLSRLEELAIDCHLVATSHLIKLRRLRELHVGCCEFDEEFVPFVAELTELTKLVFRPRIDGIAEQDCRRIRSMRRLHSLTLEENRHNSCYSLLAEGQLERLRELRLESFRLTKTEYWEFFKQFPSLRQLYSCIVPY